MVSRGFWDRFLDMMFGESAHPEATRPVLGAPMLSNWLLLPKRGSGRPRLGAVAEVGTLTLCDMIRCSPRKCRYPTESAVVGVSSRSICSVACCAFSKPVAGVMAYCDTLAEL